MFNFFEKAFIVLLNFSGSMANIVNASNHTNCGSLINHQCTTQPTPINPNLGGGSNFTPPLLVLS